MSLEEHYRRRRPWRVHVHSIGPNYSFKTETAALEHVRYLVEVERYYAVTIWECRLDDPFPLRRRTYYSETGEIRHERFDRPPCGWILERIDHRVEVDSA